MSHNDNQQTNPTCSIQPQVGFALVVILIVLCTQHTGMLLIHPADTGMLLIHPADTARPFIHPADTGMPVHSFCGYWHARSFSQKLLAGKRVVEVITASAQQLVGRCHKPQRIGKPESHLHIMRGEQNCLA